VYQVGNRCQVGINLDTGYLTAKVAGAGVRIPLLRLRAVTGGVNAAPGVLVLKGVNVRLTGTAASTPYQTFNTDLFSGGFPIGKATVIARTGDQSGLRRTPS
jgi:hypothetical protein